MKPTIAQADSTGDNVEITEIGSNLVLINTNGFTRDGEPRVFNASLTLNGDRGAQPSVVCTRQILL